MAEQNYYHHSTTDITNVFVPLKTRTRLSQMKQPPNGYVHIDCVVCCYHIMPTQ